MSARERSRSARGALLALAGACLWGTTGTSQALMTGHHSPLAVGGLRGTIAAAVLVLVAAARSPKGWLATIGGGRWRWIVPAGVAVACYQLTFFAAVSRTGVAVGTLVVLSTAPAVAGLVGWLLHGHRPSWLWLVATLVALTGAGLLVTGSDSSHALDWGGLLLALVAGACFGTYTVCGRVVAASGADGLALTSWIFLVAGAVLVVPMLREPLGFVTLWPNPALLAWLGVVATALAYLMYQQGMRDIDAARAATLALAEPMVANLLAVVVLHEPFTWLMGLGVALVLAGLGLLGRS